MQLFSRESLHEGARIVGVYRPFGEGVDIHLEVDGGAVGKGSTLRALRAGCAETLRRATAQAGARGLRGVLHRTSAVGLLGTHLAHRRQVYTLQQHHA